MTNKRKYIFLRTINTQQEYKFVVDWAFQLEGEEDCKILKHQLIFYTIEFNRCCLNSIESLTQ